jgi:hypothetical protein
MNRALMGLGLAVAVLATVFLLRDGVALRKPDADPAATWSASERRHAPEVVLAISPRATPPRHPAASEAPPPRLTPAMQEYYSAQSLKPLFDRLRASSARTPEEDFLLAQLLERCGKVPGRQHNRPPRPEARAKFIASLSEKDPQRDKRIAAYDAFNQPRCEGIEVETSDAEIRALMEKAAAAGDPKARARLVEKDVWAAFRTPDGGVRMGAQRNPSMSDAQLDAVRNAAQSGDPEALLIAGRLFASTKSDLVIRAGPEGRPIDPRAFHDAWRLAACDQGLQCGPEHSDLTYGCAMQANCDAADLRQHMFYYQHSPQQSQRVYEYYGQLTRALRSGDWSYFNFHRGGPTPDSSYHFFG